jgi:hypothetical protein
MRIMKPFLIIVFIGLIGIALAKAQQMSISITGIVSNQQIVGVISGLGSQEHQNYKVIVYVHTDQWYIHPYAGQDEGKSWAPIQKNGHWQIETVKRDFNADKVAALLVKRNYPPPTKTENLERVQHAAIEVKRLQGTSDEGKL